MHKKFGKKNKNLSICDIRIERIEITVWYKINEIDIYR